MTLEQRVEKLERRRRGVLRSTALFALLSVTGCRTTAFDEPLANAQARAYHIYAVIWKQCKGDFPRTVEEMDGFQFGPTEERELLERAAEGQVDPWGNNIVVENVPDGRFSLRSAGPDGALHTGDDIVRPWDYQLAPTTEPWRIEKDPWGSPYTLERMANDKIRIRSNGPDGMPRTEDDVVYPAEVEETKSELGKDMRDEH
jgi:hypothetical protein